MKILSIMGSKNSGKTTTAYLIKKLAQDGYKVGVERASGTRSEDQDEYQRSNDTISGFPDVGSFGGMGATGMTVAGSFLLRGGLWCPFPADDRPAVLDILFD